jgi:hypothetical protein
MTLRITVTGTTSEAVRAMYLIGTVLDVAADGLDVDERHHGVVCVSGQAEVAAGNLELLSANDHAPDRA